MPMNLNTIQDVRGAHDVIAGEIDWTEGDSWLAGGTWLYSEPQAHLRRLLDLRSLAWEPLTVSADGLRIAATCTIAELDAFVAPADWLAAPLFDQCCRSLLASFKIWNAATVGGNICMSLPAGAMTSLTASLEGVCTLRAIDGYERRVPVVDFVTGDNQNVLGPGELLVAIDLPASALRKHAAFRRVSLTHQGRSTALLIGTRGQDGRFILTITAATPRPVQLSFDAVPDAATLHDQIRQAVPDDLWFNDVHGAPDYRKHLSLYFGEQIRAELDATPVVG
jgi:CO/xanthine dehydrogenase FAD-binding subunit